MRVTELFRYHWWLAWFSILPSHTTTFTPVIKSLTGSTYKSIEDDGGHHRSIFIDDEYQEAYIGSRNYVYKLNLKDTTKIAKAQLMNDLKRKPNFGIPETMVGTDMNSTSAIYKLINEQLSTKPIQLMVTEKLAQVYKLQNVTFLEQCQRQIRILNRYYGDHLQLPLDKPEVICARHARGLTWFSRDSRKLFVLKTGVFGTLPVAPTGVSNFDKGWPVWLRDSAALAISGADVFTANWAALYEKIAAAGRTCYACNYTTKASQCLFAWQDSPDQLCYREYPIPNYMAVNALCDFNPAPTRVILDSHDMKVLIDGPLDQTSRDSCEGGNLASTLLSGYHPDQRTVTLKSDTGNGPSNLAAIYILTEFGQEKQLDVNHESYMGFEEPVPLTSSASLVLVRMMIKDDDVGTEDIVISNPFKETWVTSPLTKFGRLVKTENQATVPHRPRAVALFEDDEFIYSFFREDEWEAMNQPQYSVNRHHFLWKAYDRTVSYPWEKPYIGDNIVQMERSTPPMYMREINNRKRYSDFTFERNEHVYSSKLLGWQQSWNNAKIVSRIGRVCKNDAGLPLGVQDASVFNLDNQLSLTAFQTFTKAKLSCQVKVKAVPRSWRQRKDEFSFFYEDTWQFRKQAGGLDPCLDDSGCVNSCTGSYNSSGSRTGPFCNRNLSGKEVSFRAFLDYAVNNQYYLNPDGLFQTTVSGWSQFHWSYMKSFPTFTASSYEYSELQDIYRISDTFYGVFTSSNSEELSSRPTGRSVPKGSAVCKFKLADMQAVFTGPFKKRLNNAWRPFDPSKEGPPIVPSPYSCAADPVSEQARKVQKMDIEFTDETLPLEQELRNFDMRSKSSRLDFFEKDVEGSRTMWNSVQSEAFLTTSDALYDRIVAEELASAAVTILYMSTVKGEVHKVATWATNRTCWRPNAIDIDKWWKEETNLPVNSWLNYFSTKQESQTTGADDFLFTSEWKCSPEQQTNLLAIYKPFGDRTVKIWDMKLSNGLLILAADDSVVSINTAQCDQFEHCSTCSRDPHCGWDPANRKCLPYTLALIQSIPSSANCEKACLIKTMIFDPGQDILLNTTVSGFGDVNLVWYYNNSVVDEQPGRFLLTRNSSLLVLNARPGDVGTWVLKGDDGCIITYIIKLSDCVTQECLFNKKYGEWCDQYDQWRKSMDFWELDYDKSNCRNDNR